MSMTKKLVTTQALYMQLHPRNLFILFTFTEFWEMVSLLEEKTQRYLR